MGNCNLNNIMEHINHIDVREEMVQNQDVSLFIYINLYYFVVEILKLFVYYFLSIFIHRNLAYACIIKYAKIEISFSS
jgi:hypothetical protein